eukprot:c13916_g1_i3 orf=335-748(+)
MADSFISFLIIVVLASSASSCLTWGPDGHYLTCKIAELYFKKPTWHGLQKLLPDFAGGSLAELCLWPNDIRPLPGWTWSKELHYVETPDYLCNYKPEHNLTEALLFLAHLMGDIHQVPLLIILLVFHWQYSLHAWNL